MKDMGKKKTNNDTLIIYLALCVLVGVAIGYIYGGFMVPRESRGFIESSNPIPPEFATSEPQNPESISDLAKIDVSSDDDPALGPPPEETEIIMIEFSDYQCPFCKDFFDESFHALKEEYFDTGKVRYVFRDYPLEVHPQAIPAAVAANCAGEQDKYWEMHDLLFENQDSWSYQPDIEDRFMAFAQELELDAEKYADCLKEKKQEDEINGDLADGYSYGVTSTPSFFINGKRIVGAQPTDLFRSVIERERAEVQKLKEG